MYILGDAPLELFGYHESRRPTQGAQWPLHFSGIHPCKSGEFLFAILRVLSLQETYGPGARRLSEALGFTVSATAVQHNTQMVGERLAFRPFDLLDTKRQSEHCEVMIVEVDGRYGSNHTALMA